MAISRGVKALSTIQQRPTKTFVHWFRHGDLRLHDNPALSTCASKVKIENQNGGILPIFCFDERMFGNDARSEFGSIKCGPRRAKFILESVKDLRSNLEKKGSGLLVVSNVKAEEVFERILSCSNERNVGGLHITCQEEVASEEKKVDKKIRALHKKPSPLVLESVWGSTMYNPEELPFTNGLYGMPDTFTPFRNKVEKNIDIDAPLPTPSKSSLRLLEESCIDPILKSLHDYTKNESALSYMPSLLDLGYSQEDLEGLEENKDEPKGVMNFVGGESSALARVQDYIWDKDLLKTYFDTRNGKNIYTV